MKNFALLFVYLFLGFLFIGSCKQEPKKDTETAVISKPSTVTVRTRGEADRLNPLLTIQAQSTIIMHHMFPTLLDIDPFSLELVPVLVKTRPILEEITEGERKGWTKYTYELLDEAVWDNGTPITAKDYEYTLKMIFNPHSGADVYRAYLELIQDIEIDPNNPKKFTIYTDRKYIKAEYATGQMVLPKYNYDPDAIMDNYSLADLKDPAKSEAIKTDEALIAYSTIFKSPKYSTDIDFIKGCGGYEVVEWIAEERVVLKKKKNWWGDKLADKYSMLTANPERIVFRPIEDGTATLSLMKSGDIDVAGAIPQDQFVEFRDSEIGKDGFNFYSPPFFAFFYYGLNTNSPKLSDKKVRRALAHLYDSDAVIDKVMLGMANSTVGPFHPIRSYYHKELKPIELNIEKAKGLLADAGWSDSNNNGTVDKEIDGSLTEMELDLLITPNNKISTSIGLIYQSAAQKAGVKINIVEKKIGVLRQDLRNREFEIFASGGGSEPSGDDPKQYWHTDSDTPQGYNRTGFGDAKSDALIEAIRSELDEEKRHKLYLEFQELLYEEQPALFLYNAQDRLVVNKKFKNTEISIKRPGFFVNYWQE